MSRRRCTRACRESPASASTCRCACEGANHGTARPDKADRPDPPVRVYKTDHAFRQALDTRLRHLAGGDGQLTARYRRRLVAERLIARLQVAGGRHVLLKGGVALDIRLGDRSRQTKDLDIDWHSNHRAWDLVVAQINRLNDLDSDRLTLRIDPHPRQPPDGRSYHITATLADQPYDHTTLDVAFTDGPVATPDVLDTPGLLTFVGIGTARVQTVAVEQHAAEKLHAYTRRYASGSASTRPRDLTDLALMAQTFTFDAPVSAHAVARIFGRRGGHQAPSRLPAPPADWARPYRALAQPLDLDPDLRHGHAEASRLVDPILDGTARGAWDPRTRAWLQKN